MKTKRLTATTLAIRDLRQRERDAAFALFQQSYVGADSNRFDHDLDEKQLVILLRDRENGALKGFSTVLVHDLPAPASGTVVYSGDTVIDREYWGQKQLQISFARILISLKARSPRRKLYWFLLSKGYRTYLLLANAFPRAVPRHDVAEDATLLSIRDDLAAARFGAEYNRARGVVRYTAPHERVRHGLAPITARLRENPHVRFFVERNPGHEHGDELACLAEVRWRDLLRIAARLSVAAFQRAMRAKAPSGNERLGGWETRPAEGA